MENWQESRNYRKWKNADGTFKYLITIDGKHIEVSKQLFAVYSAADRRDRYLEEKGEGILLSLDLIAQCFLDYSTGAYEEAAEISVQNILLREQLLEAIRLLNLEERRIIHLLYFEGLSMREAARKLGVYHRTIGYQKNKILKKLKKYMEE